VNARLDLLYAHCGDLGLDVEWADLGEYRRGDYCADSGVIRLNHRLTLAEAAATLAHEVAHHLAGDRCSNPSRERKAWERGAAIIITPPEYAEAERVVGCHPNALAAELEVTPQLVLAWRRWYKRAGHLWRW
jgi:hypothetical protein